MRQQILNFKIPEQSTFENFITSEDQETLDFIQQFLQKPLASSDEPIIKDNMLLLYGKTAVGKSHLLKASCQFAEAVGRSSFYIPLAEHAQLSPDILTNLDRIDLLCIDDVDKISQQAEWERALFNLYNQSLNSQQQIIFTGQQPIRLGQFTLPDLASRLKAVLALQIHTLNDPEKTQVLINKALMRGIILTPEVAGYIINHYERSLNSLQSILGKLDIESLEAQRKITIPFVKSVL